MILIADHSDIRLTLHQFAFRQHLIGNVNPLDPACTCGKIQVFLEYFGRVGTVHNIVEQGPFPSFKK
jgi:hypothetical protein